MGTLEDAIREHLALKREQGASEEEVERKEAEAFRTGGPSPEALPENAESASAESSDAVVAEPPREVEVQEPPAASEAPAPPEAPPAEPEPAEPEPAEPEPAEPESAAPEVQAVGQPETAEVGVEVGEVEPDEVLAEEALEPDAPVPGEPPAPELAPAPRPVDEWFEDEQPEEDTSEGQDPLEEIPDFLEDTPEHERLWFEQKAPKEFDFGD